MVTNHFMCISANVIYFITCTLCKKMWAGALRLYGNRATPPSTSSLLPCRLALAGQRLGGYARKVYPEWSPVRRLQPHRACLRQLLQWNWPLVYRFILSLGSCQRHREGDIAARAAQCLQIFRPGLRHTGEWPPAESQDSEQRSRDEADTGLLKFRPIGVMSERQGSRSPVGEAFGLHWVANARPSRAAPGQ